MGPYSRKLSRPLRYVLVVLEVVRPQLRLELGRGVGLRRAWGPLDLRNAQNNRIDPTLPVLDLGFWDIGPVYWALWRSRLIGVAKRVLLGFAPKGRRNYGQRKRVLVNVITPKQAFETGPNAPHGYLDLQHAQHNGSYAPAPPNYPLRHPKYHLIETIRPLIELHLGGLGCPNSLFWDVRPLSRALWRSFEFQFQHEDSTSKKGGQMPRTYHTA